MLAYAGHIYCAETILATTPLRNRVQNQRRESVHSESPKAVAAEPLHEDMDTGPQPVGL